MAVLAARSLTPELPDVAPGVAFICARRDSEHHLVTFAKSPGVSVRHARLQVSDTDNVGRGGRALLTRLGAATGASAATPSAPTSSTTSRDPWGCWYEHHSGRSEDWRDT